MYTIWSKWALGIIPAQKFALGKPLELKKSWMRWMGPLAGLAAGSFAAVLLRRIGFALWIPLVALVGGAFIGTWAQYPELVRKNLSYGLAIALFDWFYQTVAALIPLWRSYRSLLMLWMVPVEVFLIFAMAGTMLGIALGELREATERILIWLLCSLIGFDFEGLLRLDGCIIDFPPHQYLHVLIGYLVLAGIFILLRDRIVRGSVQELR